MTNIVLVEDDADLRENYRNYLESLGHQVTAISNKEEAEKHFDNTLPDLAILDLGLNGDPEAGFDLCRGLRQKSESIAIIILSARDSDLDIVSGLRLGADDYLTKDISLAQLGARLNAFTRRLQRPVQEAESNQITRGNLTLNSDQFSALWKSEKIELSLTEFWLLHSLAKNPGHVKNRDQLMDAANIVVDADTITSHVKRIRKKFEKLDAEFDAIETLYGMGYRWRA